MFPGRHSRLSRLAPLALALALASSCDQPQPKQEEPTRQPPATQPAGRPATQPAEEPTPLSRYTDILLDEQPDFPTTQPLTSPLAIEEAARLVFDEPLFLDAVGCLWIVHERGQTPEQILKGDDLDRQTFVVTQPVVFTWWKPGYDGRTTVEMILRRPDGGYDWLHQTGRAAIPAPPDGHAFDWSRAYLVDAGIVVPTTGGAAIVRPVDRPDPAQYFRRYGPRVATSRPDGSGKVETLHVALAEPRDDLPLTQTRLDGRGLLAWIPWEGRRRPGGEIIGRFIGGEWTQLTGSGWSDRPVHLMPLTDGSILQLSLDEEGEARLTALPLNATPVDPEVVAALVEGLTSGDARERERAFVSLAGYGPGAWPILEELLPDQPPIVQKQLRAILGDKRQPTIGGLQPEPGPVEVQQWLGDGGVILRYRNGILLPDSAGVTVLERPALLLVRPGHRTQLLDPMLAGEIAADPDTRLYVWGEEWIVCRPGQPARRWLINHFAPILEEGRAEWQAFVGLDQVGRWLFRRPGEQTPTLVVDIRIPDPTPRLPTWVIESGGTAGWDAEGWPVTQSGGAWRLKEEDWEALDEGAEVFTINPDASDLLATGPDGTTYAGGLEELRITRPDGTTQTWPLPPEATGSGTPRAVVDAEGRLFLFNRPGRVVRLKPTPEADAPFEVEAVFEDELPGAQPHRVWLDPAGRICATYFGSTVAVMWPDGQVPASIRQKMPARRRGEGAAPMDRV